MALCLRLCDHADQTTVVPLVVANVAIDGGKDGPVTANANAITRMETGPKLTHDDVSGLYELPVAALYAPILRV